MWSWAGVVAAGILNGSFAVPLKTARIWTFNHIWMVHSLLAMALLPWAFALLVVPRWSGILGAVPARGWLGLIGWGLLFGVGSLLYGVAVDLLGMALGFSIQLGLSIVLGALLPLLWAGALRLRTYADACFVTGLAVMLAGVFLCAQAGGSKNSTPGATGGRFRKGLIVALVGGILAPSLNFGIQYGTALLAMTGGVKAGADFPVSVYLAWAVFLSAAAILQAGVCGWRVVRTRRTGAFRQPGARRDALGVLLMSSLWITSVFLYGRSAFHLGPWGNSFGWPIFIALIILASNAWGVVLGEWKAVPKAAFYRMLAGCGVLVLAAFLIGQGNRG
jgi:L-rhamnose-H+ transport protein